MRRFGGWIGRGLGRRFCSCDELDQHRSVLVGHGGRESVFGCGDTDCFEGIIVAHEGVCTALEVIS